VAAGARMMHLDAFCSILITTSLLSSRRRVSQMGEHACCSRQQIYASVKGLPVSLPSFSLSEDVGGQGRNFGADNSGPLETEGSRDCSLRGELADEIMSNDVIAEERNA